MFQGRDGIGAAFQQVPQVLKPIGQPGCSDAASAIRKFHLPCFLGFFPGCVIVRNQENLPACDGF